MIHDHRSPTIRNENTSHRAIYPYTPGECYVNKTHYSVEKRELRVNRYMSTNHRHNLWGGGSMYTNVKCCAEGGSKESVIRRDCGTVDRKSCIGFE